MCGSSATPRRFTSRTAASRGITVNGRTDQVPRGRQQLEPQGTRFFGLVGEEHFDKQFVEDARAVRLNNSSTQVYMALKADERIDESMGDLFFTSTAPLFRTELLAQPQRHQPHVFVLLSADAAAGPAAVPDRVEHERELLRLGRR